MDICDPTNINGLIYAGSRVDIGVQSANPAARYLYHAGTTVMYGSIYARGRINLNAPTILHYREPNLYGFAMPIAIESWEIM